MTFRDEDALGSGVLGASDPFFPLDERGDRAAMKGVIAGHRGFGAAVARELASSVDRTSSGRSRNPPKIRSAGVEYVSADLADAGQCRKRAPDTGTRRICSTAAAHPTGSRRSKDAGDEPRPADNC